jgi:hypothetical protein
VFKRYNPVTEEELKTINWKQEDKRIDANMDAKVDSQ